MQKISKAFSFVEIIISISITSLLIIILLSSKQGYEDNLNNTKILSDLETINNALISFSQDVKSLPMPGGNINFYSLDTSYRHSFEDSDTFGVYGSITETTIPKKYLDVIPLDPRTNSYYAYGKTKSINEFEIASVQYVDTIPVSKVIGNYTAEFGPFNLIREYNGPNFVKDKSKTNFPYNPDELVLIASVNEGGIWKNYREGDTISTGIGQEKEIFFSDGSVSILEENSQITLNKLNFKGKDNLNSFVKIALGAGTIWTRATKLNDESSFEIYTSDTNATVRGTIFKMTLTDVTVIEGEVDIYRTTTTTPELIKEIEVKKGEVPQIYSIETRDIGQTDIDLPDFTKGKDPREPGTVAYILKKACPTLIVPGEGCIPDTTPTELTASGYKLVAYAPYNKKSYTTRSEINNNYLKLYNNNNTGISSISSFQDQGRNYTFNNNLDYLIKDKGIFIDNINVPDFIKYDLKDLDLGNSFAIEMRVLGSALKPSDTTKEYYLYDTGNLFLKISGGNLKMGFMSVLNEKTKQLIYKYKITTLDSNTFYKVIAIYDGNNWKLQLNDLESNTVNNIINQPSINNIYIGNKENNTSQLNGIIDYVKIYKKN